MVIATLKKTSEWLIIKEISVANMVFWFQILFKIT